MSKLFRYVVEFYLTLGIPFIYLLGLYFISLVGGLSLAPELRSLALVLIVLGLLLWIISYLSLGRSFGVLPRQQTRVRRGLYHYFPHPMYLGISFTYLGLALANQSKPGLLFTVIILIPLLIFRAYWEERYLTY